MITFITGVVALIIGAFIGYQGGKETGYTSGYKAAKGLSSPTPAVAAATVTPRKVAVKPARVAPKAQKPKARIARKGGKR